MLEKNRKEKKRVRKREEEERKQDRKYYDGDTQDRLPVYRVSKIV